MNYRRKLLQYVLLFCSISFYPVFAEENISVSGSNSLEYATGDKDIDKSVEKPGDYFVDHMDVELGVNNFFFKGHFQVEEPNKALHGSSKYDEVLSRRTMGFHSPSFNIDVGHVQAIFGRGLCLNLQEDLSTEKYTTLDGVYIEAPLSFVTIKAISGRPLEKKVYTLKSLKKDWSNGGTLQEDYPVAEIDDMNYRDVISGLYTESFPFAENDMFSLISGTSIGVGFTHFLNNVEDMTQDSIVDTVVVTNPITLLSDTILTYEEKYHKDYNNIYLPSGFINLSLFDWDLGVEYVKVLASNYKYSSSTYSDVRKDTSTSSSYISLSGPIALGLSVMAEYKNWDFAPANSGAYEAYVDGPTARYHHLLQLLNKHVPANFMNDMLGYNVVFSWNYFDPTSLTAGFSFGGDHKNNADSTFNVDPVTAAVDTVLTIKHSLFGYSDKNNFHETFLELDQEITDWLHGKFEFQFGQPDQSEPEDESVAFGTKLSFGPFNDKHGFIFHTEVQKKTKRYHSEIDSQTVRNVVIACDVADPTTSIVPAGTDAIYFYNSIPDSVKTVYKKSGINFLLNLSYSYSPYFSSVVTYELEAHPENSTEITQDKIPEVKTHTYRSVGINIKPTDNHSIILEYGSFSGGQKCNLGACTVIPAFEGFKFSINSTF